MSWYHLINLVVNLASLCHNYWLLIRGRHISLRVMVGGPHNHFRFDDVSPFTLSNTQVKTDRTWYKCNEFVHVSQYSSREFPPPASQSFLRMIFSVSETGQYYSRMPPKDSTKLERKLSPSDTNSLLFSGHGTTFQTRTRSSRSRHLAQQYRTEFKQTQNGCSIIPVM